MRLLKQARRLYGHQIFPKLSASDPRKFHTTVQKLMELKKSKSILRDEQGKNLTAEIISAQFSNICRQQPPLKTLPQNGLIETIPVITVSQVQEKLKHLDIRKGSYPQLTEEGIIGYREWLNLVCWFRLFKDKNANRITKLFYEKTTREYETILP